MFVTFDPQAYRSITATKFKIDLPDEDFTTAVVNSFLPIPPVPSYSKQIPDLSLDFKFNQMIEFTITKFLIQKNRNNYIYQIASNCNRSGISQQDCEDLCIQKFDLKHSEIRASVKSVYSTILQNMENLEQPTKTPLSQPSPFINSSDGEVFLKSTPTIPSHIFENPT
ncbi:MAG: hypothetical protein IPN72_25520 [Saprospiraceae bacterium]|nr:hypothetical protein [Saprospiraceae bacterium]